MRRIERFGWQFWIAVMVTGLGLGMLTKTPTVPPCLDNPTTIFNECATLNTAGVQDIRDGK